PGGAALGGAVEQGRDCRPCPPDRAHRIRRLRPRRGAGRRLADRPPAARTRLPGRGGRARSARPLARSVAGLRCRWPPHPNIFRGYADRAAGPRMKHALAVPAHAAPSRSARLKACAIERSAEAIAGYLFVLPGTALLAILFILPVAAVFVIATT